MSGGHDPAAPLGESSLRALLEAFAVGDALGMATEFMTRAEISDRFGLVDTFIEPAFSKNHSDLAKARVTDDTEQVIALLDEYCEKGRIDPRETAERLLLWVKESGAIEKRYIGPSSKAALQAIAGGADPSKTGRGGTTCGGVMRSPAAVLFALCNDLPIDASVQACLLPTHNTRPALESAAAFAYALKEALSGGDALATIAAAQKGASVGAAMAPWELCGPSLSSRLEHFRSIATQFQGPGAVLDFLYRVYGTGLESVDVAAAALCIHFYAPLDTWLCLRMGASVGGDTDTIAALAGILSAASRAAIGKPHNIPAEILAEVLAANSLNLASIASRLASGSSFVAAGGLGGGMSGMRRDS